MSSVSTTPTAEKNSSDGLEEYYSKLKGLNESVAKFVKNHVETNPFINLQPVFKDYERYFNDLEKLRDSLQAKVSEGSGGKEEVTATAATTTTKTTTTTTTPSGFSFKPPTSNPPVETPKTTTQPQFSFGFSSSNSVFSPAKPTNTGFTFGSTTETTKTTTSGFSFGATTTSSTPFSFGSKPPENNEEENKEEEDAEPPKPDFTPVVEEGHIFTTRCKVFVKKDGNFSDRGVGNLFLKPVPSSEKVQLIVRADTSLGNLLLNLILSASLPVQRVGKKDVILVCVPTPDAQPPPVPVLLRVKSPEEADQLLETLEKHKKWNVRFYYEFDYDLVIFFQTIIVQ